jgi:uncharacterized protein
MTRVRLYEDKSGFVWRFEVEGHSGFGEQGNDIVCAAISAVAQTALGALMDLAGINEEQFIIEDGYIDCHIPLDISDENKYIAGIITQTMEIGFEQIRMVQKKYIRIRKEVLD